MVMSHLLSGMVLQVDPRHERLAGETRTFGSWLSHAPTRSIATEGGFCIGLSGQRRVEPLGLFQGLLFTRSKTNSSP